MAKEPLRMNPINAYVRLDGLIDPSTKEHHIIAYTISCYTMI